MSEVLFMKGFQECMLAKKVPHFVVWLCAAIIITVVSFLTSYFPVWANIPVNVVLPFLVLIFLKTVFFEKLKLSTLIILRTVIVAAVFIDYFAHINGLWFVYVVLAFLIINILEATFTDLKYKKYFNFVTGLVLAASVLALAPSWINLSGDSFAFSFIYEANNRATTEQYVFWGTICWIIAYTIWNWIFVTDEFSPSIAYLHFAILGMPLLGCIITKNPGLWLMFRANSLTCGGVLQISCKQIFEEKLKSKGVSAFVEASQKTVVQAILMVINIALLAVSCTFAIMTKIR